MHADSKKRRSFLALLLLPVMRSVSPRYSYLNASMGCSPAALRAGW